MPTGRLYPFPTRQKIKYKTIFPSVCFMGNRGGEFCKMDEIFVISRENGVLRLIFFKWYAIMSEKENYVRLRSCGYAVFIYQRRRVI